MAPGIKTGGRKKGSLNRVQNDVRIAAQAYTGKCLEELARIATHGENETNRIVAIRELLDRGHGRIPQVEIQHIPSLTQIAIGPNAPGYGDGHDHTGSPPIQLDDFRRI